MRPGEKMYEELFISDTQTATRIKKVFAADEAWLDWQKLKNKLDGLIALADGGDRSVLRTALLELAHYKQEVVTLRALNEATGCVKKRRKERGGKLDLAIEDRRS